MKYLFLGGDERALFAAACLADKGNEVCAAAMDKAVLPGSVQKVSGIEPADCVVLPLPTETGRGGLLNAPFASGEFYARDILELLPEGSLVCGGKLSPGLKYAAQKNKLRLFDLMLRPELTAGNAAVTAEAALAILMQRTDFALFGKNILVIGYGRIGKLLCQRLGALGVRVHVLSRNAESRAMAEAMGYTPHAPGEALPYLSAVINTAPAPVMTDLSLLCAPCIILELASAPGGFDSSAVTALGHRYFAAPGLPGRYAPRTAGELVAGAVMNIVKEREND